MKNKRFDDILNECLDRLLMEGQTVEQCLDSYPEEADKLKPLLQVAMATRRASALQPSLDFRTRARYQFHSALRDMEAKRSRSFFGWLPQWATVVTTVLVCLLVVGGGTVFAAGNSMPDEPLYPMKLATERVQLILTPSGIGKAELYAKLADRRVAEIERMVSKNKPEQVERTAQRLNTCLMMVASLLSVQGAGEEKVMLAPAPRAPAAVEMTPEETVPEESVPEARTWGKGGGSERTARLAKFRRKMLRSATDHPAALRAMLRKAPESARPALLRAIAISEAGYEKALRALD